MTRLETMLPDLAAKLKRASAARQKAASLAACEFAIVRASVEHAIVGHALARVREVGELTPRERSELDALAAELDEKYFTLQEAAEEGRANAEDFMLAFSQARAISALSFAGGDDAHDAATEAIYEAAATTDNVAEFAALIESALQQQHPI